MCILDKHQERIKLFILIFLKGKGGEGGEK